MNLTSNSVILKEYIDWVFLNKVVKAKRRLTSISFLTNEKTIYEYKMNVLILNNNISNIKRSMLLPDKYKLEFSNIGININTYGDLAFIYQTPNPSIELMNAFIMLEKFGCNKDLISKII